ncbi:MAG: hypothetical protein FWD73_03290, partial [Polyangiaceae bacterium]|nr:hypothetical protein [Polyangiaceae bacterium]
KWAYFFRQAPSLEDVPPVLSDPPLRDALEAANTAGFNEEEWDSYIRNGMAIQSERGALSLATKQGEARGEARGIAKGLAEGVLGVLEARSIHVSAEQKARILDCSDIAILSGWIREATSVTSAGELFSESS